MNLTDILPRGNNTFSHTGTDTRTSTLCPIDCDFNLAVLYNYAIIAFR